MTTVPDKPQTAPPTRDLAAAIARVAHALAHELPPGDVAALRRLGPHDPSTPAFYRALAAYVEPHCALPEGATPRDDAERRWAVILAGMAVLPHSPRRRLGHAAADAGLTEMRFLRLLRDSGDTLAATVRGVIHFLASKNEPADFLDVARLVISDGHDWGEGVRRSLARDFYSRSHRLESGRKEQP